MNNEKYRLPHQKTATIFSFRQLGEEGGGVDAANQVLAAGGKTDKQPLGKAAAIGEKFACRAIIEPAPVAIETAAATYSDRGFSRHKQFNRFD